MTDNSVHRIGEPELESDKTEEKVKATKKPRAPRIRKLEQIACPMCGEGHIVKGRTAFGCSRFAAGCRFLLPFTDCPADTTPAKVAKRIKG